MLWASDVPVVTVARRRGRVATVTVIAGALGDHVPPSPPPDSWASHADADVAIWQLDLEGDASWTLPAARGGDTTVRVLYVYGGAVTVGDTTSPRPPGWWCAPVPTRRSSREPTARRC